MASPVALTLNAILNFFSLSISHLPFFCTRLSRRVDFRTLLETTFVETEKSGERISYFVSEIFHI